MGANSNYPAGTWAGDPDAPWNIPDMPEEEEYDADGYDDGGHYDVTRVRRIYDDLVREVYEPPIARWGE